jgi:lysophospholipase L1-like esterase
VWLGDSTAAGVGASPPGTLPFQVASQLAEPVRLTVLARSGARVADVVKTQLPQLAHLYPTEVFVSVGANDATHLTWRSRFRRDYGRLLAGLPPSVTRVVLLGVPDMGAPTRLAQPLRTVAGWRGRELATDIRNLARRFPRAVYVDIAGATGGSFRRQPGRYFASDHYHPDDAGYHLWAMAVAAALQGQR